MISLSYKNLDTWPRVNMTPQSSWTLAPSSLLCLCQYELPSEGQSYLVSLHSSSLNYSQRDGERRDEGKAYILQGYFAEPAHPSCTGKNLSIFLAARKCLNSKCFQLKMDKGENGHWEQTSFFDIVNALQDNICCCNEIPQF